MYDMPDSTPTPPASNMNRWLAIGGIVFVVISLGFIVLSVIYPGFREAVRDLAIILLALFQLIGAIIMVVLPEVLRFPDLSNYLFLAILVLSVAIVLKSWKLIVIEFAAMIAVGFVMNVIFLVAGVPYLSTSEWIEGPLAPILGTWVFMPEERTLVGNIAFVLLVVLLGWMLTRSRRTRLIALPFVLWLTIFTWEVRLLLEPSVTRQLLIGALLVVLMAARPQGLFGKPRVEVL